MKVYDVFSKLSERDMPLVRIEEIVIASLMQGIKDPQYTVITDEPDGLTELDRMLKAELLSENKKVAYVMYGTELIAAVGYRED